MTWLQNRIKTVFDRFRADRDPGPPRRRSSRGQKTHVIILDGTLSSFEPGYESNAGLLAKLLDELGPSINVYYRPGLQWHSWRSIRNVLFGGGLDQQIRDTYGALATRYRPEDRIFLFGYSRGAFAVRSLSGLIDRVGLLKAQHATPRNIEQAWRAYKNPPTPETPAKFHASYCHQEVSVEMIGVWDTVRALGLRVPFFWRWMPDGYGFHNHHLCRSVKAGFHALAKDETRLAYRPEKWRANPDHPAHLEQVWFRGTHGDIGGHLSGFSAARPLSNIPLVWMLERADACNLPLPKDWASRYPTDANAPSIGHWQGFSKLLILRRRRVISVGPTEWIHPSVAQSEDVKLEVHEEKKD
ncbi:MAG: DUF2235 domain-containing protein [Paracoccaceae bacterium]